MYEEDDYLMLSGIQHFAFCRRQWGLIHIEQQWEDNYHTTAGVLMHDRAHDETLFEKRGDKITARGMRISSGYLGLSGQCDIVEFIKSDNGIKLNRFDGLWRIVPVEYKRGKTKENDEDELQLCAQAVCLEEMFITRIEEGYLYYGNERSRAKVLFSEELRNKVKSMSDEMHMLFSRGHTPKAKANKRCKACSLVNICVPKLLSDRSVAEYMRCMINCDINE